MKVTYNWLKDFVEIKISPSELADKLTMIGLEVTSQEAKEGDFVFEIEVTSNRPDCLSVIGLAREIAASTNKKLKLPKVHSILQSTMSIRQKKGQKRRGLSTVDYRPLSINIESKADCPLYTAKVIEGVRVRPSCDWLKRRLELIGCRSINSIVDITNYILFTWGEPLHAFDLDKLICQSASLVRPLNVMVRRARNDEEIITIDGLKRKLNENILIIASAGDKRTGGLMDRQTERPIAIAGIMGGRDTEVTENTKNILLEAAVFNPLTVRRGRRLLGLLSESAYRFERGINPEILGQASWAAVTLIQDSSYGECTLVKSSGVPKIKKKSISLEALTVQKILGVDITPPRIKQILNNLGFKTKTKVKNNLTVEIPAHRPDVNLEIDLIEEIARIFGYGNIPRSLPRSFYHAQKAGGKKGRDSSVMSLEVTTEKTRDLVCFIKNILVGMGLNEVITYSLMDRASLSTLELDSRHPIEIANPLSKEQEILRASLIPGLAQCIAYNLNQKQSYVNIFEIAKIFSEVGGYPQENLVLGIGLCGIKPWLFEQGLVKDQVGLLHLKGIIEVLFERLGIKNYTLSMVDDKQEAAVYVNKEKTGVITKLQKSVLDNLDIKNKYVFVAELSLDKLLDYVDLNKKFVHPPIYPGITRDISLILKDEISVDDILRAIIENGKPLLIEAKVSDYYKGKQIPVGFRGLTISCLYRSHERTLTEVEISPLHYKITNILVEQFGAKIR